MGDNDEGLHSELHIQIGMLVIEGRVFKEKSAPSICGNHCPKINQAKNSHVCLPEDNECQRAKSQQNKIDKYWTRSNRVTIDVVLMPECVHHSSGHLIERWKLVQNTRSSGPMVKLCLLQAVNSSIYFSQLNSWWTSSKGFKPQNIQYRIYGESTNTLEFSKLPQNHKFPPCENMQVILQSLPRQNEMPHLKCPECFDIALFLERGRSLFREHFSLSRNSSISSTTSSNHSPMRTNIASRRVSQNDIFMDTSNQDQQNVVLTFNTSQFAQDMERNDSGFIDGDISETSNIEIEFKSSYAGSSDSDDSTEDYIIDGPLWSPGLTNSNIIASPTDRRLQSLQQRYQDNDFTRRPSLDRIRLEESGVGSRSRHSSLDSAISNFAHLELQTENFNVTQEPDNSFFPSLVSTPSDMTDIEDIPKVKAAKNCKHYNLKLSLPQNDSSNSASGSSTTNLLHAPNISTSNQNFTALNDFGDGKLVELNKTQFDSFETTLIKSTHETGPQHMQCNEGKYGKTILDENGNIVSNRHCLFGKSEIKTVSENIPLIQGGNNFLSQDAPLRSPPSKLRVLHEQDVYGKFGKTSPRKIIHKPAGCSLASSSRNDKLHTNHCNNSILALSSPAWNSSMIYEFDAKMPKEHTRSSRSKCKGKCMKKNGHVMLNFQKSTPVNRLLGNFEESILHGRLPELGTVEGFNVQLGASGSFCPDKVKIPLNVKFYHVSDDNAPSPYLGTATLQKHVRGKRGYHIPNKGTLQLTLFNPNESVVKMFVMLYDLSDMPPSHRTFIRHKIYSCPVPELNDTNITPAPNKSLKYCVHLWIESTKTGKIYMHGDMKILFSLASTDWDSGNFFELKSETLLPNNPKYSPKK